MLWTLSLLRSLATLFFGPLYIPCLAVLALPISHGSQSIAQACLAVLSAIVGCAYVLIAFCFSATYFSRDPVAPSLLARPHSSVQVIQMTTKSALTLAFIFLQDAGEGAHGFLIALVFIGIASVACAYTRKMPFFHFAYNQICVASYWILTFAASCLVLLRVLDGANAISIFFFVASPLVAVASQVYILQRRRSILSASVCSLLCPFDFERTKPPDTIGIHVLLSVLVYQLLFSSGSQNLRSNQHPAMQSRLVSCSSPSATTCASRMK